MSHPIFVRMPARLRPLVRGGPEPRPRSIVACIAIRGVAALAAVVAPSVFSVGPAPQAIAEAAAVDDLAVVDQMWGPIGAMVGVGDRLYVAQGARVLVVDGWHGAAPSLIGRSPVLAGPVSDLALDGDRAAVSLSTAGVAILDVADPRAPRLTAMIPPRMGVNGVALAGDRLWVGHQGDGLVVYDLRADPPREMMTIGGQVQSMAAESGRVAVVMARSPIADPTRLLIWPDGAHSPNVASETVEVSIPFGRDVAVVQGRVVVAGRNSLAVHDLSAVPAWTEVQRRTLDTACGPGRIRAGGGRVIVTCDYALAQSYIGHVPSSGPMTIDAGVWMPEWTDSAWIDGTGLAVGMSGRLRTFGAQRPDGGLAGLAVVDLGPDVVAHAPQEGELTGLSGNMGRAWQARVVGARAGGVERIALPEPWQVLNPAFRPGMAATDDRFILTAAIGSDLELAVVWNDAGVWRLAANRQRVIAGDDIAALRPRVPGDPWTVVVPAFDRVVTAAVTDDGIGPFDGRLPWPAAIHPRTIHVDGQRVWLGTGDAALGFERRADGWHALASLPMPTGVDSTLDVHVRAAGDDVYTLHDGTLSQWDISDPQVPRMVVANDVGGEASGFGFTDASRRRLWVGAGTGLLLFDRIGGRLAQVRRIETRCLVDAWLPASDGVIALAWGCGALILRSDGAAPPPPPWSPLPGADLPPAPTPTASPSPQPSAVPPTAVSPTASPPTATPSPASPTAASTTAPTAATGRWTIYLPWVNDAAWQR